MTKTIKDYIQFAIDNGYTPFSNKEKYTEEDVFIITKDIFKTTYCITSKPFIEAIVVFLKI